MPSCPSTAALPMTSTAPWWAVGRSVQRSALCALLSVASFSPHVRVLGPPASGKTRLVQAVLKDSGCTYAFVDCLAVASVKTLLSSLLRQLLAGDASQSAPARAPTWRDGVADLAQRLSEAETPLQQRTAFIVLKHAQVSRAEAAGAAICLSLTRGAALTFPFPFPVPLCVRWTLSPSVSECAAALRRVARSPVAERAMPAPCQRRVHRHGGG